VDLAYIYFKDVDLNDSFFDSLKQSYAEFPDWFAKKAEEKAYVFKNENGFIDGFLYLKVETGEIKDTEPVLPAKRRMKIGTFKLNAHGTRMGERFIKKTLDHALYQKVNEIYVTIFPHHTQLVSLFCKYGFKEAAKKHTINGTELVLIKKMGSMKGNAYLDYPYVNGTNRKYILSLYPQWHTRLLPDSILKTENPNAVVNDISHTNSIHKIYLTAMDGIENLQTNDILVIYRTSDGKGPAHYRSVATSVCVVEEVKDINQFVDENSFLEYSSSYSIFTEQELKNFYKFRKYPKIIRFSYNIALTKRVTRGQMMEDLGINESYWGFFQLTDKQFAGIIEKGNVDESLIVY